MHWNKKNEKFLLLIIQENLIVYFFMEKIFTTASRITLRHKDVIGINHEHNLRNQFNIVKIIMKPF